MIVESRMKRGVYNKGAKVLDGSGNEVGEIVKYEDDTDKYIGDYTRVFIMIKNKEMQNTLLNGLKCSIGMGVV